MESEFEIGSSTATLPMEIHALNPINDSRWKDLLHRHPKASVFHTGAWLEALRLTYGYEPIVFTTSPPGASLENGLASCDVRSWLTGHRLVSLPFSDYCEPLFDSAQELNFLVRYLQDTVGRGRWSYIEVRPMDGHFGQTVESGCFQFNGEYFLHRLDLQARTDQLFHSLDKDSVQRRVRRAERAGLAEECGRTEVLLRQFYDLLIVTRKRHQLPPQPYAWFRNLVKCFGEALEIRVAYKDEFPIASILTLQFKDTVYYKYGCSDARFNNLGATPLLLWRAIVQARSAGALTFDLGRTEVQNSGLVVFKDKWAPRSERLIYLRFPRSISQSDGRKLEFLKQIFARMPAKLLAFAGSLIYRHIG
jgi:Acetyltransferase (GNAT) domain